MPVDTVLLKVIPICLLKQCCCFRSLHKPYLQYKNLLIWYQLQKSSEHFLPVDWEAAAQSKKPHGGNFNS